MGSPAPEPETTPAPAAPTTTDPATAPSDQPAPEPSPAPQDSEAQPPQPQDSEATAPPSPPLPQKHTPVTPGARAARLLEVYDSVLRRTLARVDYDNFAACFPTVATYAPNALRNVQKQMVDYLDDRCNVSFPS